MSDTGNHHEIVGFGEFPIDWEKKKLVECCEIRDKDRIPLNSKEREEKKPGSIPYYGANGKLDEINDFIFDGEFVLLAEDGGHFNEYQERPIAYKISGKAWVNNHAHILEANNSVITDWLLYSLEHRNLVPYVGGSTRGKLTQTMLKKVDIPLPPLPEQRKIASVLHTVDQAIQKTEEIIEQTERVKKGVSQRMIFDVEASDSEEHRFGPMTFRVPDHWESRRLKEVTDIITRGSQPEYAEEGVPVINQECIYWEGFHFENLKTLDSEEAEDWKDKYFARFGDILINSTGRGTLGRALVYDEEEKRAIDSHVTRVRTVDDELKPGYLRYFLETTTGQGLLYSMCVTGSTSQIELSKSKLGLLSLPVPPLNEQEEIIEKLQTIDETLNKQKDYRKNLHRLKRGLMQKLLTGEVRTKDLEIEVVDAVREVEGVG